MLLLLLFFSSAEAASAFSEVENAAHCMCLRELTCLHHC